MRAWRTTSATLAVTVHRLTFCSVAEGGHYQPALGNTPLPSTDDIASDVARRATWIDVGCRDIILVVRTERTVMYVVRCL